MYKSESKLPSVPCGLHGLHGFVAITASMPFTSSWPSWPPSCSWLLAQLPSRSPHFWSHHCLRGFKAFIDVDAAQIFAGDALTGEAGADFAGDAAFMTFMAFIAFMAFMPM